MNSKLKTRAFFTFLVMLIQGLFDSLQNEYRRATMQVQSWRIVTNIRAQAGGNVVGVLVGLMVSLLIAVVIVMNLITSQTQAGWSLEANNTWTSLQANIWVALALLVIAPIIIGAVIILGYVRRGM